MPPHSYISVRDFQSPRDLAKYLHHLMDNPVEYLSYFWWMEHYQVVPNGPTRYMEICDILYGKDGGRAEHKVIEDLDGYWARDKCQPEGSHPWSKYDDTFAKRFKS